MSTHKITHNIQKREDILDFLPCIENVVAVELGIAEGELSNKFLAKTQHTNFFLYSVDAWAGDRGHGTDQYLNTVQRLRPFCSRNIILRAFFDDVLPIFGDNSLDFVYVDGYAHTGENNGSLFDQWYPKVKPGAILAGDDYHKDWPLVIKYVDLFAQKKGLNIHIVNYEETNNKWSKYPSWFVIKKDIS